MADLGTKIEVLEDWRRDHVDPNLRAHSKSIDELESWRDQTKGSLRVIIWLNSIIVGLLVLMLAALFSWGLDHITVKAVIGPPNTSRSAPQDAKNPYISPN